MFDYTMAAYRKTVKDCKNISYITSLTLQVVYLIYLVYAVIAAALSPDVNLIINSLLFLLSSAYLVFFLILTKCGKDIDAQKRGKIVKKIFTWCKRLIKVYTLGVMIYGVFQTVTAVNPFAVVFAVLMVVVFVLQIVFDILLYIVEKRLSIFITAITHDIKPLSETVRKSGNFFKKLKGEETEPEPFVSELDEKNLEILAPLVEKEMETRREKQEDRKQERKRQKQEDKERRKAEKLAKRLEKRAKKETPDAVEEIATARKK